MSSTKTSAWTPELIVAVIVAVFGTGGAGTLFFQKRAEAETSSASLVKVQQDYAQLKQALEEVSSGLERLKTQSPCPETKVTNSQNVAIGHSQVTVSNQLEDLNSRVKQALRQRAR